MNLRSQLFSLINKQSISSDYGRADDGEKYGLEGVGSTLTDYAAACAFGAKFSPAYGFCTMVDDDREVPLIEIKDMDNIDFKHDVPNSKFKTITLEIGIGSNYLGGTASTRKLIATEYTRYNFDELLLKLPNMLEK